MRQDELKRWIKSYEDFSNKPYICTAGKLTIGFGRNIQDNGISDIEAEFMFNNDMKRTEQDLLDCTWYVRAPAPVKDALFNMCFNLGLTRLLGFKKMIKAIVEGDYTNAAIEALDSKWATQVGERAKDIALMIREANET